ncbi:hypothetical protein OJ252_3246 [Cryptosporidium canis]|uniref:Uncharacterized protein n=1 Tax=Cryptosporidium canis TaxID=195482 RepID=A0ABQ8P434_9CRYT|nr:hypothetical protein OJ252_3246 [Cryptosporidium canis]
MEDEINISHFRKGAEAILHQLDEICGGSNPKMKLGPGETRARSNCSSTLSSILQQYSDYVSQGEGVGYIGIDWKGPFPLHNAIIQHIKRVQLLIGKSPSLVYGVIPNIKYGYLGLENVLYIFPLEENLQKNLRRDSLTGTSSGRRNSRARSISSNFDQEIDEKTINDESILTIVFPFSIKNLTGTFPRVGIFSSDVEYLLCVITEKSIHLVALKFDDFLSAADSPAYNNDDGLFLRGAGLMKVPIIKIGGKDIGMLQCSLPGSHASKLHSLQGTLDGRFFFLEENSSNIYELVYQSSEGWITPYCYIHSHQVYSSFTKELFLKYTFLRFMPRLFSIQKISLAPCGFMAILDTSQNIYIAAYINDLRNKETLSNILPWGRAVNSLSNWASNLDINTFTLPTDWDEYTSPEFQQTSSSSGGENLNIENFSLGIFKSNSTKRFSSPSSLKVVSMLRKKELLDIFSKIPGNPLFKKSNESPSKESVKAEYQKFIEINDIQLCFTSDYNLSLSVFMNNGTRLQFQCSKGPNEEMPSIQSVINGFRFEPETLFESPKKKIQTEKTNCHSNSSSLHSNGTMFGFWLTYILPIMSTHKEASTISKSYYRNGLTIITRNTTSPVLKDINANTDFSITPSKNICKVELRLFSSLPADIGMTSGPNFGNRSLNSQNSPALNLRYNGNFSSTGQCSKGEPIIVEFDEQIKAIHEFSPSSEDPGCDIMEDFPILAGKKNRASPAVFLEYGWNPLGNNKRQHELLGWVKDRCIVFVGETRYFFLVLKWNGLQQINGASGLFMQLIQYPFSSNASLNQFRRLVHPEDSFLTDDHLSLTSPWIEAISGAIAFDLRSVLELSPLYKYEGNLHLQLTPQILETCLSKLQCLLNILSRSQNLIGSDVFESFALPSCPTATFQKPFSQILSEELGKDHDYHLKESTTFVLKSLSYITNMLLQLVKFLIVFSASPEEIRSLTYKTFEKHDENILTEMPTLYLIVSNKGVHQIRKFVESFSVNILEAISQKEQSIVGISYLTQIKLLYKKIGWILNDKSSRIMKRLALIADLSIDTTHCPSSNILKEASMIERISSRNMPPIGGFPLPPFKYWEHFQTDPSNNEYFREIFSSLLLRPFHKVEEATLLLLDCISHFEHMLTEQLKIKQNFNGTISEEEFDFQNQNMYFMSIEQIIKAWSDSLCDTLLELTECETTLSEMTYNSMKSLILLVICQPIKTLFSSCFNSKVLEICMGYLLKDVLPIIMDRLTISYINKKGKACCCQFAFEDLIEVCRHDSAQRFKCSERSLLLIIASSLSKPFKISSTNEHLKEYGWNNLFSFLQRVAIESKYYPCHFILLAISLLDDDQESSYQLMRSARIMSELSLNKDLSCGSYCMNFNVRIEILKLLREICISGVGKGIISTEMNVSQFIPRLFTDPYMESLQFQMSYTLENAISNAEGILSVSSSLQIPLIKYIEKLTAGKSSMITSLQQIISRQVLSCSDLVSLINSSAYIEPFSAIVTLLQSSASINKNSSDIEDLCSQISDYLLQIFIPPKDHIIYSHLQDGISEFQLPIMSRIFDYNGSNNLSESIQKLLEFIQSPLLNITGSSLLGSLSIAPKTYLSVGLSNQEIFEKYDLFQQIYSITAVFEFINYYISMESQYMDSQNLSQIPISISINLWNKYWSVPYDLLFDVYISLLDSSITVNPSSNPFLLILNRMKILESPIFNYDLVSKSIDFFTLHIRKCIIGILLRWIKNKSISPLSRNHISMANNFVISTSAYLKNTFSRNQSQLLINHLENIQLELQGLNL